MIISSKISHNNNLNVNHKVNQFVENTFSVCVLSATSGIWHMSVKVQIRPTWLLNIKLVPCKLLYKPGILFKVHTKYYLCVLHLNYLCVLIL